MKPAAVPGPVPAPVSPEPCLGPGSLSPTSTDPPLQPRPAQPYLPVLPPPRQVELEEGRRFQMVQEQTRAQRACHLLTYLRVNTLNGLLVGGAISAIFWATKYSQDNKEVPGN